MPHGDPPARAPRIVVTLAVTEDQAEPRLGVLRNELYVAAVARHGATPVPLRPADSLDRKAASHRRAP